MPPKKKKIPKSGFSYFMEDLQHQFSRRGLRKPSLAEMVTIAGPRWTALAAADREEYNIRAKIAKGHDILTLQGKLTSDGKEILQVQAELLEKEQEKIDMKSCVGQLILNMETVADIAEADIVIMAFNLLCRTDDGRFIPNEVGMVKLSLNEGITEKFHKFIYPGPVPFGYTSDAKLHSESTHQIPIYANDFEEFDENYIGIYNDILKFIDVEQDQTTFVYCLTDDLQQNASCLAWLYENACIQEKLPIAFADITYLLIELCNAVAQPIASDALAESILNQHCFDYSFNIRCSFHDELDNAHCAVAYPHRLSYILLDHLCPLYSIPITEKHLPSRLSRNVVIEMWKSKTALMPVVNEVPLVPAVERSVTTPVHNSRSSLADSEDIERVPSSPDSKSGRYKRPVAEGDKQFPSFAKAFSNMHVCDSRPEWNILELQSSNSGIGDASASLQSSIRGRGINSIRPTSSHLFGSAGNLYVGFGRGVLRK